MAKVNASGKNGSSQKPSPNKRNTAKRNTAKQKPPQGMSQERFDRLMAEANAPYKGLRKFIYASVGASGAVGGFVFLTKILAGRDIAASLPNLALQVGIVALMVFLFRWEDRNREDS